MTKYIDIREEKLGILPGYVGNLTDDQTSKLKEMWIKFFDAAENATGDGTKRNGAATAWTEGEVDPKATGIPKSDKAKEELKEKEEQAELKALLSEYGGSALRDAFWQFVKMDSPDSAMLRFLRARKWNVSRAFAMLASCLKWRLDNDVESLAQGGDLGNGSLEKFLDQQRSGKTYALGTSLNEQPVCYIHVKKHFTFSQPSASLQKYVIYAMESFRLLMTPPNDKVVLCFDLQGFGLRNMDWSCILFIVKALESYYPESLGTLYIHSAPFIFRGIWYILGPLLDPVVREKVVMTKCADDLSKHVPMDRLIKSVGGECETEFVFVEPKEGENGKMKDEEKRKELFAAYMKLAAEYKDVTKEWAKKDGKDNAILEDRRLVLAKAIRLQQFKNEPYYRGRTVYHRDGTLIGSEGIIVWYYKQSDGSVLRHVVGRKNCAATLQREIQEIDGGASLKDTEAKTAAALEKNDWITLYGSEATAKEVEGDRFDSSPTPVVAAEDEFHETPEASKALVEKTEDAAERAPEEALAAET